MYDNLLQENYALEDELILLKESVDKARASAPVDISNVLFAPPKLPSQRIAFLLLLPSLNLLQIIHHRQQ